MPIYDYTGGAWQDTGNNGVTPSPYTGGSFRTLKYAWVYTGGAWHLCWLQPPTNLSATDASVCVPTPDYKVNLSWTLFDGGANETNVYRDGSLVTTVAAGVHTYQDTGLADSTTYNYNVTSYDGSTGEGPYGNTATVTTTTCS